MFLVFPSHFRLIVSQRPPLARLHSDHNRHVAAKVSGFTVDSTVVRRESDIEKPEMVEHPASSKRAALSFESRFF